MAEYVERVDFDSRIRVRFGGSAGTVRWFVVQLEYNPAPWLGEEWIPVARFNHQPDSPGGHDVYEEGLHVDRFLADGTKWKHYPEERELPATPGVLLRECIHRLRADYRELRADFLAGE